jgi:hypothetical protein
METAIGELVRRLPHELRVGLEDGALKDVSDGNYKSLMDRIGLRVGYTRLPENRTDIRLGSRLNESAGDSGDIM